MCYSIQEYFLIFSISKCNLVISDDQVVCIQNCPTWVTDWEIGAARRRSMHAYVQLWRTCIQLAYNTRPTCIQTHVLHRTWSADVQNAERSSRDLPTGFSGFSRFSQQLNFSPCPSVTFALHIIDSSQPVALHKCYSMISSYRFDLHHCRLSRCTHGG